LNPFDWPGQCDDGVPSDLYCASNRGDPACYYVEHYCEFSFHFLPFAKKPARIYSFAHLISHACEHDVGAASMSWNLALK
jgi:hypothetical protein